MGDEFFGITDEIQTPVINRSEQIGFGWLFPVKFQTVFPDPYKNTVYDFFGRVKIAGIFPGKITQPGKMLPEQAFKSLFQYSILDDQSVIISFWCFPEDDDIFQ